ncbi:UvrD-helicase domain-containing protein [Nocardia kruczakiae]|uniref:UvrD-helicase domain-containing protein n=1 Tax=Nocardia kruczakiae TaxID=261477 RepID=UPI000A01E5DF|nr:UvrD-helicase domain-containing protein [Nocardia kruczakiae]
MTEQDRPFTEAQLSLIQTGGSQYVQACPGAGKTHAIAERFVRRPNQHPRKGIGLLSFTNAAAEEAATRCSSRPDLLRAPNFIGTIDKFINRFIVSPVWNSQNTIAPRFLDIWGQLANTTVKSRDFNAPLDWFVFDKSGNARLERGKISPAFRTRFDKLESWQIRSLQSSAAGYRRSLIGKGYISAESSRLLAQSYLDETELYLRLSRILAHRFTEIIVDEVQDCSNDDLRILDFIRKSGIELVLVGDPDQAIYDFRGDSTDVSTMLDSLAPKGKRLSGNFRSTPAICAIATSLRSSDDVIDAPAGRNKDSITPVLLLKYEKFSTVAAAMTLAAATYEIGSEDCIVLAHKRSHAAACAGGSSPEPTSDAKLQRIALATETLQAKTSDGISRRTALRDLTVCLQELAKDDFTNLTAHELYERLGYSEAEHTVRVLRLAHALEIDRRQAQSVFRTSLTSALRLHGFDWVQTSRLRTSGNDWSGLPATQKQLFDFATIHSFKGLQRKFVTVAIPSNDKKQYSETGVGQWLSGEAGEPRRVLYVGATRAEEVLMLAVHKSEYDAVYQKLIQDGVDVAEVNSASKNDKLAGSQELALELDFAMPSKLTGT